MEANLVLAPKQEQTLAITQEMEQSIKILEMDAVELREYIQSLAMENPAVDMDGVQEESSAELRRKKMEWLQQQALRDRQYVGYYDPADDVSLEKVAAAPQDESLTEHLLKQAVMACDGNLRSAVEYLIGFLDDNGYLQSDLPEIAEDGRFPEPLLREALQVVHAMDPSGVGALNLSECLLLQLPEDAFPDREIVEKHLEQLARNRPDRVARQVNATTRQVTQAFERIRRLNPRPGSVFSPPDPPAYVTPDVLVTAFQDRYYVLPCEFSYPQVHLSSSVTRLLGDAPDEETKAYIDRKIRQVEWVQKCIANRSETLLAVSRAIVRHQERFFRFGPQYLNVLRMSDIADDLEMHESTVSRAVRNKYLQCAHGTWPLRHFFVQGTKSGDGDVSSHTIRHQIRSLIEEEDKSAPLSDQKIADLLSAGGSAVSRRTVAKYRDQMGIPNSSWRR